jgi:drug/metabolite transporter (DMT)-like permease
MLIFLRDWLVIYRYRRGGVTAIRLVRRDNLFKNTLAMTLLEKISTRNDERSARLAGIGLMLTGVIFFSLGDALGKFMVKTYSVGELLLLRAVVSLILVVPLIWRSRGAFFQMSRPAMQLLRVALSILEIAAFFAASVYLPLADIITFYLAAPIFVTALSSILLGEHVDVRRWAAVGIGFCGILIALRPSAGVFDWPAAIALGGSIGFALLMVVTRSLRGTPDIVLASMQFLGTIAFGAIAAPVGWLTPSPRDFGLFLLAGGLAVLASLCVNRSLKLAPFAETTTCCYRSRLVELPQLLIDAQTPRVRRKQSTGVDEPNASKRCSSTPLHWKPHFSSTLREAGLATRAPDFITSMSNSSKVKSITARAASVAKPCPQCSTPSQ